MFVEPITLQQTYNKINGIPTVDSSICANCHKHEATENWVGQGSMLDFIHGSYSRWCKCCCLKAQIKHCRQAARRLNGLLTKLEKVKCK